MSSMIGMDHRNNSEWTCAPTAGSLKAENAAVIAGQMPALTVIIPTKNRPEELEVTLRSLFCQTVLPRQLIIVDQSENDESMKRFGSVCASVDQKICESIAFKYIWDVKINSG